ncbi:MAG: LuxR C-terminal-related transcriptional regulator [Ilumatobacter sp.]
MGVEIVGRTELIDAVRIAVADAHCAGVLLVGEAGIGKSFLAEHVVDVAASVSIPIRRLYAGTHSGDHALGLLTAGFEADSTFSAVAPTVSIKRALEADGVASIVLVDDVDALDDVSASILCEVAESSLTTVIATMRSGATLPASFAAALTTGAIVQISCPPLDAQTSARLAERVVGRVLTTSTRRRVHDITQGNPLYIRELMTAAVESGALQLTPHGTELTDVPAGEARLSGLLQRRLDTLAPNERAALRRIAGAGRSSHGELAPFVDEATIRQLEERRLVATTLDARRLMVTTAHPLHAEILRSAETPLGLRQIRSEIAECVRGLGMRRIDDRFRLAVWSLDGICEVDAATLAEATGLALASGDTDRGVQLAKAAFAAEGSADNARVLGYLLYRVGDFEGLKDHLQPWRAISDDVKHRVAVAAISITAWFWQGGDVGPLNEVVANLEQWEPGPDRDHLQAVAAATLITHGRIDEAVALAEALGDLPPGVTAVRNAVTLGHGWRSQGRPLAAAALVAASLDFYRAFGPDVAAPSDAVMAGVRIQALADAGEFAEVDRCVAAGSDAWRDAGDSSNAALAHLAHGWSWYLRGNFERSAQLATDAIVGFEHDHQPGMVRWGLIALALSHAQSPDSTRAEQVIADLDSRPAHPAGIFDAYLDRARGWVAHRRGFTDRSRRHFVDAIERASEAGNLIAAVGAVHDLARTGSASVAAEHLACLHVDAFEGRYPIAQIAHVRAVRDDDLAALEAVVTEFDRLGAAHLAADGAVAIAMSSSSTPRQMKKWLQVAADYAGRGQVSVDALAAGASLTPREREIAALVVQGLTSREAAERLGISRRTVETHLSNAYAKLGVNDRIGLIEAVGGVGAGSG